ncbi:MAG: NAD(P)/FAD-dependent oxidoreductase [Flavobacteriaceae bacterium]
MTVQKTTAKVCIVIGASHAGVNVAFALRREGWDGTILLFDADKTLPYHRPPLSKTYFTSEDTIEKHLLKPAESYDKENITLRLGATVSRIDSETKRVTLDDGETLSYDKLVIATGARPIIPPIPGIETTSGIFPLRTAADVSKIRDALKLSGNKKVVIVGGGYIGLETAASLSKLKLAVTVLEREERILARVTAPDMSDFFQWLHQENGVEVLTSKDVVEIKTVGKEKQLVCGDGSYYLADMIILGVGIKVNKELAASAGLKTKNGICVDDRCRTSNEDIFAIGDCTYYYSARYDRFLRLESVQNAIDQAKVAAMAICGKETVYDSLPWFWSDQYDVKLQMVGLSEGFTEALLRKDVEDAKSFSVWYFKGDRLLAVDAVNNTKAYVYGTKIIKADQKIDKSKLVDPSEEFKLTNLLVD